MLSRRQLIQRGAAGGAGLMFGGALVRASALGATSVASSLTPYRDPMPLLVDNAIDATTTPGAAYDLAAALVTRKVHQQLPAAQFFGYLRSGGPGISDPLASYLGPAIVAKTGVGFSVNYQNGLAPDDFLNVFKTPGAPGSSYLQFPPHPEVRTMTHLHGARVAAADDGNPYFDSDAFASGSTQSVTYPNEQPATLLWYHDHYVGDTRMNVVAGLAAGYLIRDNVDTGNGGLGLPHNIPAGGLYELPLVIQDRQWNPDGSQPRLCAKRGDLIGRSPQRGTEQQCAVRFHGPERWAIVGAECEDPRQSSDEGPDRLGLAAPRVVIEHHTAVALQPSQRRMAVVPRGTHADIDPQLRRVRDTDRMMALHRHMGIATHNTHPPSAGVRWRRVSHRDRTRSRRRPSRTALLVPRDRSQAGAPHGDRLRSG